MDSKLQNFGSVMRKVMRFNNFWKVFFESNGNLFHIINSNIMYKEIILFDATIKAAKVCYLILLR